jgi:hypothetical protein
MFERLLGIDTAVLQQCTTNEQLSYKLAVRCFAFAVLFMVLSDAYFGYLFSGSWWGVLGAGACLGFIHYSIYRLALITLTTRPLTEIESEKKEAKRINLRRILPSGSGLFRIVFVGLIALAVSFPAATALYHNRAETIMQAHREELKASQEHEGGHTLQHKEARFPFLVFEKLLAEKSFQFLILLFTLGVFIPLALLAKLRKAATSTYTLKIQEQHRQVAERDFFAYLIDSQDYVDRHFGGKKQLRDILLYEDPPFNTRRKNESSLAFGNRTEFRTFLNRIGQ